MKHFFYFLFVFTLTSCVSTFNTTTKTRFIVELDAYGNDSYLSSKKYIISSGDSTIKESNLQYIEFSDYIKKILTPKGYKETQDWDSANVMIFFKYGISDPETFQETYAVPTWGQTGVSSTTTKGSIYANPYSNNIGYNQTTTSNPTYGVTGTKDVTSTYTKYFRYITLSAYDLDVYKKSNKEKIVWNMTLTSSGVSDDLRRVIPYMVFVGSSYIGKSSGEKKAFSIYENDERVNQLKGISNGQ